MDYKCENQGHSIPKYFTWVKWPIWRTPLACSNSRHLSIVCISYWRAETRHTWISDVPTPSQKKSIPTVWYPPRLKSASSPFSSQAGINNRIVTFGVEPTVIFPMNWKSNDVSRQQSKTLIFKYEGCISLIFCFALRNRTCLCLGVWLGKHSGVCGAQGLWIAILA